MGCFVDVAVKRGVVVLVLQACNFKMIMGGVSSVAPVGLFNVASSAVDGEASLLMN